MQLAYIIPADAAEISGNNKLSILGGEISEITSSTYPAFGIRLAFVVKLLFGPNELNNEHSLQLDMVDKEENALFPRISVEFVVNDNGEIPIPGLLILNLPVLIFPSPGEYYCRFYYNNAFLRAIPLRLKQRQQMEEQ